MKKNLYLIAGLVGLLLALPPMSFAADRIGFINIKEVMQTSIAGKKATEEMQKMAEKKQGAVKAMESEIKKLKDELDKQGSVMTPSARSDKESAYQRKLRDYQILVEDTNKELQKRDHDVTYKMLPEVFKAARTVADREKYSVILDITQVVYFDKSNDITKKVIDEYNKAQNTKK